jgi:hypothetical protein
MNNYYVYIHYRNDNLEPFYVGKGKDKRAYVKCGRSIHWNRVVDKYGYHVVIQYNNLSEDDAFYMEMLLIESFGFKNLVNATYGGEGSSGAIFSDETKRKIGEKSKGRKVMLGKKHSDETKEKMRKSRLGKAGLPGSLNPMARKVIDLETSIIYDTIKEVSILFSIKYGTLKDSLSKNKNKRFKYYNVNYTS